VARVAGAGSGAAAPVLQLRQRVSAAQVNAGLTLLAAPGVGYKYRLVDVRSSRSAARPPVRPPSTSWRRSRRHPGNCSPRPLPASRRAPSFGPARPTRPVLADGASFTANDENTAITIGKTGASLTGSTDVDVLLSYSIDKV
jgi:hypothetical protein